MPHPSTWLRVLPQGLWCEPGGFFIDPTRAVDRAVITHAHSDHARPGHRAVLASADTLALMRARLGEGRAGETQQALSWGETLRIGDVRVWLQPAGHVLGSAQVAMEYQGARAVVSGDYKRTADPTCAGFVPVPCDVFVTEATFALPVFRHPPPGAGDRPAAGQRRAVSRPDACRRLLRAGQVPAADRAAARGGLGPADLAARRAGCRCARSTRRAAWRWATCGRPPRRRRTNWWGRSCWPRPARWPIAGRGGWRIPVVAMASGWMRVRQRAKSRGVELPLVISDHADWDELNATLDEVGAPEVWVTHGREEALIHAAGTRGIKGRGAAAGGLRRGGRGGGCG